MRALSTANFSKKKRKKRPERYVDHEWVFCLFLKRNLRSISVLVRVVDRMVLLSGVSWAGGRAHSGMASSPAQEEGFLSHGN